MAATADNAAAMNAFCVTGAAAEEFACRARLVERFCPVWIVGNSVGVAHQRQLDCRVVGKLGRPATASGLLFPSPLASV